MEPRPVLLFDVMDTLVHEPFHDEIPAFFGMDMARLLEEKHPTAWLEFERGEIEEVDFLRRFFRDGRAFDHAAFKRAVSAGYRWLPGMQELLAELREGGAEIHALSNYPEWYRVIEARLGLSRFLSWSFVSCRTGVRKPDARAFHGAAASLGLAPAECLLVDDRDENCAAARAMGMRALRFRGVEELRPGLARHGFSAAR